MSQSEKSRGLSDSAVNDNPIETIASGSQD